MIALVVTIAIMGMIVGASINIITGDGGLIDRSNKLQSTQNQEVYQDELDLIKLSWEHEKISNPSVGMTHLWNDLKQAGLINSVEESVKLYGAEEQIYTVTGTYIVTTPFGFQLELKIEDIGFDGEKGVIISEENYTYEDGTGTAVIPVGFCIAKDVGNDINKIETGLVISDVADDDLNNSKGGNQFVWVPCNTDGSNGLTKYAKDTQYNDGTTATKQYYYKAYTDWKDEVENEDGVNIYNDSVNANGGFYVARFEAGIPSNADFYGNLDEAPYYRATTTPSKKVTTYKPVSKKGVACWNYISQEYAKIVSQKMYNDSTSVTSSLIDSYAWDTIVNWMESENTGIATDSSAYGNYYDSNWSLTNTLYAMHTYDGGWEIASTYSYGSIQSPNGTGINRIELPTGVLEQTKVLNIYDMAGGIIEITTEYGYRGEEPSTGTKRVVARGGSFYNTSKHPVSSRLGDSIANGTAVTIGFRVVLYIK